MERDDDKPLDPAMEEYVLALLSGGLFAPPDLDDQPEVDLSYWRVLAVEIGGKKSHHVSGTEFESTGGRMSSPIAKFEPEARRVITRSGRAYNLIGEPAPHLRIRDREYVLDSWMRRNGLARDAFVDVTPTYTKRLALVPSKVRDGEDD